MSMAKAKDRRRHLFRLAVRPLGALFLAAGLVTALFWIARAYQLPALLKAIIFSGFGLC